MKLIPQKALTGFQPVNLVLTIESAEELRHLKTFAGLNLTIPDAIKRERPGIEHVAFAVDFLKVLQGAVEQIYNTGGKDNGN